MAGSASRCSAHSPLVAGLFSLGCSLELVCICFCVDCQSRLLFCVGRDPVGCLYRPTGSWKLLPRRSSIEDLHCWDIDFEICENYVKCFRWLFIFSGDWSQSKINIAVKEIRQRSRDTLYGLMVRQHKACCQLGAPGRAGDSVVTCVRGVFADGLFINAPLQTIWCRYCASQHAAEGGCGGRTGPTKGQGGEQRPSPSKERISFRCSVLVMPRQR